MKRYRKRKISRQRMTLYLLFGFYIAVMLYLLFFQRIAVYNNTVGNYFDMIRSKINMIPFKTIIDYSSKIYPGSGFSDFAFKNLGGNIVLFIPMGIFLPTIWRKMRKLSRFIIAVCLIISAVELIQLFTLLGSCDIDDLIFNAIGASIGFGIWKLKPFLKLLHKYKLI